MSNNPLPNRERIKLPRQKMPEQLAQIRAHNFQEVNTGFDPEQAAASIQAAIMADGTRHVTFEDCEIVLVPPPS